MNDEQIRHMAARFLAWPLPENFCPDGGVRFQRVVNEGTQCEHINRPTGTNLIGYDEAVAMVRHLVEGLPASKSDGGTIRLDLHVDARAALGEVVSLIRADVGRMIRDNERRRLG